MKLRPLAVGALLAALPGLALAQEEAPPPPSRPAEIETQALRALDAWSVGVLTQQQGAMARDVWANTDPAFLAALYERLPSNYDSPAMQNLAQRVLFSGADAPRGDASEAARKRFEAMGRMGAADELSQMAAGAGNALSDPQIAQYAAQAELARGRRAEACARGRAAQSDTPAHFILRLRAYCAAVGGDRAAADLALELARTNGGDDAWYTGAVSAAAGAPGARPPAARYDNSLSAQLSIAAQLRPGPNPLANSSTLALVALARNDATPQPIRAQAAALAYRRGAISAADTRTILAATPAEITSALPPLVTALRRAETANPPPAAAGPEAVGVATLDAGQAIAEVLGAATTPADFTTTARFFKDDIARLQNAPNANAALIYARAAIAAGDAQLSQRLTEAARGAGVDQAAIAPLDAALAVMQNARGEQAAMAVQRRIDAGGASGARAAARDVAILAALGFPADGAAQRFVLANAPQGGARADAGAMLALANAGERRAAGEAALLAVVAAGQAGPARLDADSLANILRALRAAGLGGEARRIGVEALLAGQPAG